MVVAAAVIIAGITFLRDSGTNTSDAAALETPTSTDCVPQPYQPCGGPIAPFTDGTRCTDDHADYDGQPANGCEATPDTQDGTTFSRRLSANLVPADDVDRYPTP